MVSVLCMQIYLLHPWSDGMTLEEIFLTIIVFFFNCAYSVFFYLLAKSSPKVIAELKSTYLFKLFLTTAEFNFFPAEICGMIVIQLFKIFILYCICTWQTSLTFAMKVVSRDTSSWWKLSLTTLTDLSSCWLMLLICKKINLSIRTFGETCRWVFFLLLCYKISRLKTTKYKFESSSLCPEPWFEGCCMGYIFIQVVKWNFSSQAQL